MRPRTHRHMNQREIAVAHPEPTAPIAGAPRLPKTSTQLAKTLSRLARTIVHTIGATRPTACRTWRKTTKA